MQSVSALIAQFGAWLWFALAVLLLVLELLVPGCISSGSAFRQ